MKKFVILTHRWMSIVGAVLLISWLLSGIVFTFRGMPSFSNEDRLSHLSPLDLSIARIEPIEAARNLEIKPTRLRVGMHYDGRPVYRFQGSAAAYADTGEKIPGRNQEQALSLVRQLEPAHAATVRYDRLLEDIDVWTAGNRRGSQLPLHKIALGDSWDTYYYISQASGEPVMKTDRASRFWGLLGPVLHQWYFTPLRRNSELWDTLMWWGSLGGMLICVSGLVAGVWMYSLKGRFRKKGAPSRSPYSGWLYWHHYAGLIFGTVTFTWMFSGALSASFYQGPSIDPTPEQRTVATGGPIDLSSVTLANLRNAVDVLNQSFQPREIDIQQFRGDLYVLGANGPAERPLIGATDRDPNYRPPEYRMVWLDHPERGSFTRFSDDAMMEIARESMPGVNIADAEWIHDYDNYYRTRKDAQPLPVLRVRYADPTTTWLYIDPHRGGIALRVQQHNRNRRWLYNGLHKFDFPYIYSNRTLWASSIVILSIGGLLLSMTTLVPTVRRLNRHAQRGIAWLGLKFPARAPVPAKQVQSQRVQMK